MKTLSINWVNWIKVFFMPINTAKNSQPALYHRASMINAKNELKQDDQKPGKEERKPFPGDLMRTAHRGHFLAGPTFLFHPGWFIK